MIEYNGNFYLFHGLAKFEDFNRYKGIFTQSMKSFNTLSDPDKLNRQPDRIYIKEVKSNTTLSNALKGYKMPADRLAELSLINGMKLSDPVKKGTLIKVIGK